MAVDRTARSVHDRHDAAWRILPEAVAFREQVLENNRHNRRAGNMRLDSRRPLPHPVWFETAGQSLEEGKFMNILKIL
jgi:hypothetical protein